MLQNAKGTNDFFPEDNAVLQAIMAAMAKAAQKYGYQEILTPAIENLKTLTAKSGDEIKDQIFLLKKKGSEELGLKFDLTVPMTRMFVSRQRELPKPVKWYSTDRMWRYEAPQKGREREFYQISVENFGTDKPEADAELINLCIDCLLAAGLRHKDFALKINHRKLLEGILLDIIPKGKLEAALRIVDKSGRLERKQYIDEMKKSGINNTQAEKIMHATKINGTLKEAEKKIKNHLKLNKTSQEGLENLKQTLSMVNHPNVVVDLSVARGLAYYTGCVFEAFDSEGMFRALCGGGRYDQLVSLLGGQDCPAAGFAIGYSTLSLLLAHHNKLPKPPTGPEYYIVPVHESLLPEALKLADKLRTKYSVEVDLMRRKISKSFDYANSISARNVIVVGEKELRNKAFTVKNMKTGKEAKLKLTEL